MPCGFESSSYIMLVEDGNGYGEKASVCLLTNEDENSISLFSDIFKTRNAS